MTTLIAGQTQTLTLPTGEALTIVAAALSSGRAFPFAERVGDTAGLTAVAASETVVIGPYNTPKRFQIETLTGSLAYTTARVDFPTLAEADALAAASRFTFVGTVGDLCEIVGAGAPVDYTDGSPPATGEAVAGIGSRYTDITAGKLYINSGTKAQPLWKIVTSA